MNKKKSLLFLAMVIPFTTGLSACAQEESSSHVLRILSSEDYIYLNDPESGYEEPDMIDQFIDYVVENYPEYEDIEVVYNTSDTNETILSELQTGKSNYDLMCVSDYMVQKMVSSDLAIPFLRDEKIESYEKYASVQIKERLGNITAIKKVFNEETGVLETTTEYLRDYTAGYMWGTLGILFNPNYFEKVDFDEAIFDMQEWSSLWDEKYQGTISIKNSMRDTYAVGILETYKDELNDLHTKYEDDGDLDYFKTNLDEIFNRCDEKNVNEVKSYLDTLKANSFGLEVDSGKQDIITNKIGVNIAWSGDAVYSMDQAEDEEQVGENTFELYYSVPEIGANLWFDTWVMPDCPRTDDQVKLARIFLEFMNMPENASQNMDYTGYTSFIGGDSVLELIRDWYDIRTEEIDDEIDYIDVEIDEEWEVVDLSYFFNGTLEEYEDDVDTIFYTDCYLPFEDNISVGRQFFCQYPDEGTLSRCAVMKDYGENNTYVMKMWEDFKSDPLPTWAIILFISLVVILGGGALYFLIDKKIKYKLRKRSN